MFRKEHLYTEQLFAALQKEFSISNRFLGKFLNLLRVRSKPEADVLIEGNITDRNCSVVKGSRKCEITCFDIDYTTVTYKGPQFFIHFQVDGKSVATGRTFLLEEAITSVKSWMDGRTVEELYIQFSFVDRNKRALNEIRDKLNLRYSKMIDILQNEITQEFSDSYSLWFKRDDRSSRIYFYGHEDNPRYLFHWDETKIFETTGADENRLGALVKKWVYDKSMPSSLRSQFPEVEFGKLAEYYEKGIGIEGEFVLSWDAIEEFYKRYPREKTDDILAMIKQMRANGFDQLLRAGQSMHTLILSRARRHWLKEHHDSLAFSFGGTMVGSTYAMPSDTMAGEMEIKMRRGPDLYFDKIEYNDMIDSLLKTLAEKPID